MFTDPQGIEISKVFFVLIYQIFVFTLAFDAQILRMLDLKFRRCYSKIYHSHSFHALAIERDLALMNKYETDCSAYIVRILNLALINSRESN